MIKQILLALILLSSLVNATTKTIDLREGDSFLIRDKNVTIIDTNKDDKVKICVNNIMNIISDSDKKFFNGVYIDIRFIENNITKVKLDRDCIKNNCSCDESCNNDKCLNKEIGNFGAFEPEDKIKEDIIVPKEDSNIKNLKTNNNIINYLGIFLLLIVFIFILLKFNK